jgi:hypothetical protein
MAITWVTALSAVGTGLLLPSLHPVFAGAPSIRLANFLLASVAVIAAHKVESYVTREFDQCPVYLGIDTAPWAPSVRQAAFVVFCSVFLGLLLLVALVIRGGPWPMLALAVWAAQGLHELHHAAKSVARRAYYPGTATAVLFVLFMDLGFVPAYVAELALGSGVRGVILAYWLSQPLVFLAFWLEDLAWLRKAPALPARAHRSS